MSCELQSELTFRSGHTIMKLFKVSLKLEAPQLESKEIYISTYHIISGLAVVVCADNVWRGHCGQCCSPVSPGWKSPI